MASLFDAVSLNAAQIPDSFRRISKMSLERFVGFAVVAYFSGWIYVNEYFSGFNVNRSGFSFDDYTVFVNSFFVLVKAHEIFLSGMRDALYATGSAAAIGVIALLAMLLVSALRFGRRIYVCADLARRIVLVALGFGFLWGFSVKAGQMDAEAVKSGQARGVEVTLTSDFYETLTTQRGADYAAAYKGRFVQDNVSGSLALLWRNDYETLILRFESADAETCGDPTTIYRFPNSYIAFIETTIAVSSEAESQDETESREC